MMNIYSSLFTIVMRAIILIIEKIITYKIYAIVQRISALRELFI